MTQRRGQLVVAATPIGNVEDASPRLRAALVAADVIAAEDTRRLRRLAHALGVEVRASVVSYFEGNETQRAGELLETLRSGGRVVLLTDAGMPGLSDPGYRLVAASTDAGVDVTVIPGPSAVTSALAVSGLPTDRFCFEGFLPRRAGERRRRLDELAREIRTMVFFEAPHRLTPMLIDMRDVFGDERAAVVCRELTKTYEEVRRGSLRELVDWVRDARPRGEITVVVSGASRVADDVQPEVLAGEVAAREATGVVRKDAIAAVARLHAVPKRLVYDAVVAAGKTGGARH